MRCPFCHQPIDRNNAWKGTADRFYCSEFCADSEPIIPSRQQSLKERFDRQYLARCPPSALVGQIRQIEEGSVSGSS